MNPTTAVIGACAACGHAVLATPATVNGPTMCQNYPACLDKHIH